MVNRAEETLGSGAVEISSSGVILLTDKRKAGADEDSNAVYNRICTTLQSLIDEAQSALQKSDTPTSPTNPSNGQDTKAGSSVLTPKGREGDAPLRPLSSIRTRTLNSSGVGTSPLSSPTTANRRNPRDSFSRFDNNDHERISRPPMFKSFETDDPLSLYNPWESTYAGTSEVSRIYWRQKHEEQHDRYRKSCQRVTLELEQRFYNTSTDSDDSEAPSERSAVSTTLSAIGLGPSSSLARDTRPLHRSSSSVSLPLRSSLRKSGSKSERLKKKYQVQFLNLQPLDPMESSATTASASTSTSTPTSTSGSSPSTSSSSKRDDRYELTSRQRDHQVQRSVKHQSVGSNRSRGVVLQLYELWQQTWLRTRIMHVIAGSVEVVIIIWIVIRASRATLTWFGIQPKTFSEWLSFAYNRQWRITGGSSSMASSSSAAAVGTTAKEIYAKIRKDGIRLRHVHMWNQGEPEALVEDVVMGMKVGSSPGLTPSNVIYGPAKKVLIHAATGVVLACLSDGARRLARKL
ncbi:hypothetical protein BGW38_008874 [Lunasporangiospora selenospora]|uniref:Uncharacterized protein n=1 Tax=Lunasporangiospora selenospora TaxID=979761 RepID=A0A9P6FYV1_9FUNG|nr:hypothetical protein BGW38_008874 [Lunasporangiospora selenospora]